MGSVAAALASRFDVVRDSAQTPRVEQGAGFLAFDGL
jgi:hypothetical protein